MEKQINEIFSSGEGYLKISYVLSKLDFSNFLTDYNSKFTLVSVIRLYLFRLLKGLKNFEGLVVYLNENEEEAFQLGFYKDEENKLELPPKRTYNHYLQNIEKEEFLCRSVDLIVTPSIKITEEKKRFNKNSHTVLHAVDAEMFCDNSISVPEDLKNTTTPRIGFV